MITAADKVRFIDRRADSHGFGAFAVEVSTQDAKRQFITIYLKGNVKPWINQGSEHDAATYHAEGPHAAWIEAAFPGKADAGWTSHFHVPLAEAPRWSDVEPFTALLSEAMCESLRSYFHGNDNHV